MGYNCGIRGRLSCLLIPTGPLFIFFSSLLFFGIFRVRQRPLVLSASRRSMPAAAQPPRRPRRERRRHDAVAFLGLIASFGSDRLGLVASPLGSPATAMEVVAPGAARRERHGDAALAPSRCSAHPPFFPSGPRVEPA